MSQSSPSKFRARRRLLESAALSIASSAIGVDPSGAQAASEKERPGAAATLTLYTFGDSVLDCGRYNDLNLNPGQLIQRNDDSLFPNFIGRDLQSRGPSRLVHRAVDGATVDDLAMQSQGLTPSGPCVALLTIGGNDILRGLAAANGVAFDDFESKLEDFMRGLAVRPVLIGTVYDPTFGDDSRNFLAVPAPTARRAHKRLNVVLRRVAQRHGRLVDIHAHFLTGDPSWFTRVIEPSLVGASELRRIFLEAM